MPENTVGDDQVQEVSRRLEEIQESLSPDQAALLSGIFTVAADAIRPTGDGVGHTDQVKEGDVSAAQVRAEDPVPSLADQFRQQFLGAFTPAPAEQQQQQEQEEPESQPSARSAMIIPRTSSIPRPIIP